jgi:hypothetical protein
MAFPLRCLILAALVIVTVSCSSGKARTHRGITPSSTAASAGVTRSATSDALFNFQEDANSLKDDLAAYGSQEFALSSDIQVLQLDIISLQNDALNLQIDQESNNPDDACNDAAQGRIDRSALFGDQTNYGQDASLASADVGHLEQDGQALQHDFTVLRRVAKATGAPPSLGVRKQLHRLLAKVKSAASNLSAILQHDNPRVTRWTKQGASIYQRLHKACEAVR